MPRTRLHIVLLSSTLALWITSSFWQLSFTTRPLGIGALFGLVLVSGPGEHNDVIFETNGLFSIYEYECDLIFPLPYFVLEPWRPHFLRQMSWAVGIPFWLIMLPIIAHLYWVIRRHRQRILQNKCVHCGFDLRACTGDICTECGRKIQRPNPKNLLDGNSYGQM